MRISWKKKDENYSVAAAWVRHKIMFSLINAIISCIPESRTVANKEEIIKRSLPESTKTSKHLSEMNIRHSSMLEEVRQYQNVVKHLWIVILEKIDTISCVNQNMSN